MKICLVLKAGFPLACSDSGKKEPTNGSIVNDEMIRNGL